MFIGNIARALKSTTHFSKKRSIEIITVSRLGDHDLDASA